MGKGRSIQIRPTKPFRWGVFDAESLGVDASKFRFAGARLNGATHTFLTPQAFWDWLETTGPEPLTLYAHHVEFDLAALCFDNPLFELDNVCLVGSRFICGSWKHVTFADSHNHLSDLFRGGGKLSSVVQRIGLEKGELPPCLDGRTPDHDTPCSAELDYNHNDLCVLESILIRYFEWIKSQEINPKPLTLAQNALQIWLHRYLPEELILETANTRTLWVSDLDAWFRQAYYGGRTEVYDRRKHDNITAWDVCGMYPSVMREGRFPHPSRLLYRPARHVSEAEWGRLLVETEGMARGIATVPKGAYIGPLPVRMEDDRTLYPRGTFLGSWCFPEIRAHLARGGSFVPLDVIYSEDTCEPFRPFVDTFFEYRLNSQDPFEQHQIKLATVSLYGKLGQAPVADRVFQKVKTELGKRYKGEWTWNPFRPTLQDGSGYWMRTPTTEHAYHSVLCWAAYTTSLARVRHLEGLERSQAVYGDTDSAWSTRVISDLPKGITALGEWRPQVVADWARFYNAKTYEVQVHDGPLIRHCKGLPARYLDALFAGSNHAHRRLEIQRLVRLLEAASTGAHACTPLPFPEARTFALRDTRRLWHSDGESQPHIFGYQGDENVHACC